MKKGKLLLEYSKKKKVITRLQREDGKIIPLSFLKLKDLSLKDKPCEYEFSRGRITRIVVEGETIYPQEATKPQSGSQRGKQGKQGNQEANTFSIGNAAAPKDTRQAMEGREPDNYLLKLNKMVNIRYNKDKEEYDIDFYKAPYKGKKFQIEPSFDEKQIKEINQRHIKAARNYLHEYRHYTFQTTSRLIIGLGGESVFETSLTLHHLYGIPYIPASAIKGLARSWAVLTHEGRKSEAEAHAFTKNKYLCDIFGVSEAIFNKENNPPKASEKDNAEKKPDNEKDTRGEVVFWDAFPRGNIKVVPDIMNVHYPEYYKEGKPPVDYQQPNPIHFLVVEEGAEFDFIIGMQKKDNDKLLDYTEKLIKESLREHGIGAKTAVGYGRMITKNT